MWYIVSLIARGAKDPKNFATTPLINHLKRLTAEYSEYDRMQSEKKAKPEPTIQMSGAGLAGPSQPTLQGCLERAKVWDINHDKVMTNC